MIDKIEVTRESIPDRIQVRFRLDDEAAEGVSLGSSTATGFGEEDGHYGLIRVKTVEQLDELAQAILQAVGEAATL